MPRSPSLPVRGKPAGPAAQLLARSREGFLRALQAAAGEVIHHPGVLAALSGAAGACFDDLAGAGQAGRRKAAPTGRSIDLVHAEESDYAIALITLDRRLQAACGRELAALHLSLRVQLAEGGILLQDESPLGTACVCRALRGLKEIEKLSPTEALRLLNQLEAPLARHLGDFYRSLGHELADRALGARGARVAAEGAWTDTPAARASLPIDPVDALRQAVLARCEARPLSSADAADQPAVLARIEAWLADSQASGTPASIGASDLGTRLSPPLAAAVEVVETVCERAETAPDLPPAIRAQCARLRVPLQRLALRSDALLALERHPAWRLVDRIANLGRTLAPDCRPDLPVCRDLATVLRALGRQPRPTRQDFSVALMATEAVLTGRRKGALAHAAAYAAAAAGMERRELALHQASRAVYMLIGETPAGAVPRFLAGYWVHVLAKAVYRHGPDSLRWTAGLLAANRLLASAVRPADAEARARLGAGLPALVQELEMGLAWIGLPADRIALALAPCGALHASLIAGRAAPEAPPVPSASPPVLGAPRSAPGLLTLKHKHYVAGELALPPDWAGLQPGDGVAVALPDGQVFRGFVAELSPSRQVLLIADGDSPAVLAITARALARQLAFPATCIFHDESLVDEAAIDKLLNP